MLIQAVFVILTFGYAMPIHPRFFFGNNGAAASNQGQLKINIRPTNSRIQRKADSGSRFLPVIQPIQLLPKQIIFAQPPPNSGKLNLPSYHRNSQLNKQSKEHVQSTFKTHEGLGENTPIFAQKNPPIRSHVKPFKFSDEPALISFPKLPASFDDINNSRESSSFSNGAKFFLPGDNAAKSPENIHSSQFGLLRGQLPRPSKPTITQIHSQTTEQTRTQSPQIHTEQNIPSEFSKGKGGKPVHAGILPLQQQSPTANQLQYPPFDKTTRRARRKFGRRRPHRLSHSRRGNV